jgi:hypothetical protein
MDPNANLDQQLRLATQMIEDGESGMGIELIDADRLAELVLALDEWIMKGGALPSRWAPKK